MNELLMEITGGIVSAHVSNNAVSVSDVPGLISGVYAALAGLGTPAAAPTPEYVAKISERKSLANPAHLISMIDGKPYKTLRRHISLHGMTPESYRKNFNLSADYPMTAPDYSATRKALAIKIGLGRKGK